MAAMWVSAMHVATVKGASLFVPSIVLCGILLQVTILA